MVEFNKNGPKIVPEEADRTPPENVEEDVVSMTECTGLIAAMPKNKSEKEAYEDIYDINDDSGKS